jgi:hypothetical protein
MKIVLRNLLIVGRRRHPTLAVSKRTATNVEIAMSRNNSSTI